MLSLGIFVKEIQELAKSFESNCFVHVLMEANEAAHCIAHMIPIEYSTKVWMGSYPLELEGVIASEICLN